MGILLLIVVIPTGESKKQSSNINNSTDLKVSNVQNDASEYKEQLEQELENALKRVDGVGKVKVMITLKDDGDKILDKNINRESENVNQETVIFDSDDNTHPYVTSNELPKVEGVLVVAQGGGQADTDSMITDAIIALFDVEMHKIKIVKMSK